MVQWLGFSAFTAKDQGSNPGWGTKIPQATGQKNKIKIKNTTNQSIKQKRSGLSDTENELVVISGEREGGRAI